MTRSALAAAALAAVALAVPAASADVTPHAGMLRFPDVSKDSIVFVYAGDLWTVSRDGGVAVPLASPAGSERMPKFSPDGRTIAFTGNYEGGVDLYTIPADGGLAERVTFHPAGELLCDWTPDGRLVFASAGFSGLGRMPKLLSVPAGGGLAEPLPVPYGANASVHAKGEWLAYTPHSRDARTWKRYRGGMATDVWLFNLNTKESKRITDWEGTDTLPMWHGDTVYYLSDAGKNHRLNIWAYELGSGRRTQITDFADYDVKWPSIGPGKSGKGEIVFQHGADLMLLDLSTKKSKAVEVRIPGDRETLRPQRVDATNFVQSGDISATGKRAVAEARGDIWTMPAEKGSPRNLTRTSGTAERTPSWSPDGRWIAYFSDASGEYELYVTQSDGKGETRQLTEGSQTWYMGSSWSPDSKKIAFWDKAAKLFLHDLASGETKQIDQDPWGNMPAPSWSHDARWITYARGTEDKPSSQIHLYDVENDAHHDVTSGMFGETAPVFDRKGDYLYYVSGGSFNPRYSDIDTSFVYVDPQLLVAVPLRADVKSPWLLESDEETWKEEKAEDEAKDGAEGDEAGEADDADADEAGKADDADDDDGGGDTEKKDAAPAHPLAGRWSGTLKGLSAMGLPPEMDSIPFTMSISVSADGALSGSTEVMGESDDIDEIVFDAATGAFEARSSNEGISSVMKGTLKGTTLSGTWEVIEMGASGSWEATKDEDAGDESGADGDKKKDDKPAEKVEIDLDGFEARAFALPVPNGRFGNLAVNDKNQLLYVRAGKGVMLYDLKDDKKEEKTVAAGMQGFAISGDGKKILTMAGRSASIQGASAGGSGKPVVTAGAVATVDLRAEWKQVFLDAWRLQRDFFYVENMHGVDWPAMRDLYLPMIDDCASREDVAYVIGELIGEINVGHAYVFGGGGDPGPMLNVGMLGVDFELADGAYRIATIHAAGPWDLDARGPLHEAGLGVKVGDYLLAVNDVPVDPAKDPYAAFIGTAGREISITVSDTPEMDDSARTVVVKPIGSEAGLRYRAWIEKNRRYVEEKSGGKVGYIYVPNTGVDGQTDLFRQFYGQIDKAALIIDERWNGGGQIPTRFIELLNRPVTNYWARRDGKDWTWPPDSHQGPKCMLINGLAGSGGDMFPWLFKHNKIGKLIGTRTWGGLVGISGNPSLIDGGYVSVPTFGFYEKDGTWGIEGHGVDPDIEVIDDPAKMWDGGDPQLDAAIALMLEEIEKNGYTPAKRPADPDRSGMGIEQKDK